MWLIAVALPIQGVAAATMLHCGSVHEQRVAVPSNEGHAHQHHHAGMHSVAVTVEGGAHHHGHDLAASHTTDADAPAHHHTGGTAGCSVCASCCGAAALPVMPLVLASQDRTETVVVVQNLPTVVFLTDGPERPPRTTLA